MSTTLGQKTVGSSVYMNVNGSRKEFLVVHQGLPSSDYDASCNNTWLLMKDIYENKTWDGSNNDYANSDIHSYLNGTFLNLFDNDIKNAIQQIKLPYWQGTGSGGSYQKGSNGLSTKIFLLSGYEVGFTKSQSTYMPGIGAKLSYFESGTGTSAKNKRKANYSGSATFWWLRSPHTNYTSNILSVYSDGDCCDGSYDYSYGVRPALVLSSLLSVSDDGTITVNTEPSFPSSITVPSSIAGGSTIAISWGASTDPEGNLAGYKVEKSTDGGSNWSQIYQGQALTTNDTVAFGTPTVMYRVKAYDTAGLESGYKTSPQRTVVNNTPPSAPPSISVPMEVKGGSPLVISWGASTDSEGNVSGYKLERKVDGGAWTQIFDNNALTYTDTITKGWNKVQYRVKAYDPYSESGYTTSAERTVDNNTAPTITCSYPSGSNLGTKSSGFSVNYSVNDPDTSDSVSVTEKLDGVVKRTYVATKEATNAFQITGEYFMKVLNGQHTMTIEATDGKATVTYTLYFTKAVTAAIITLEEPMEADDKISVCAITVAASIPADAEYTVEVTNNANDTTPVWEDVTNESKSGKNHLFRNETAQNGFAFNFRVTARRGSSGIGGFINSIQGGFQ